MKFTLTGIITITAIIGAAASIGQDGFGWIVFLALVSLASGNPGVIDFAIGKPNYTVHVNKPDLSVSDLPKDDKLV